MNLNDRQMEAVNHAEGPMLVLAGPGSGKTRVLVSRVMKLIQSGLALPSEVFAVTFTNKAAGEMRKRLEEGIGPRARDLSIGTFHSTCLKILRVHAERVGLSPNFLVYDDTDQLVLVKNCLDELNYDTGKIQPRSVLERISRSKDACESAEQFARKATGNPFLERVKNVFFLYQKKILASNAVDFGDLIGLTVKLFESNPDVLASYQRRWRFVMVDEYQDTNNAQYKLVEMLGRAHKNVFVVGDDDQSIYRWRGADVSNILRFDKDFPESKVVRLEQNYRSTKNILAAAEAVVSNNAGRKSKSIWTANDKGEKPRIISFDSERGEAEGIGRAISGLVSENARYGDISVFYRTNAQSRPFEDVFRKLGIPYRIFGGLKFYERAEVKDVLAYLRLVADPKDDIALRRIVNVPARGIGNTTIGKLADFARERNASMFSSIRSFVESQTGRQAAFKKLLWFEEMINSVSETALGKPLGDLTREILDRSEYVSTLAATSSIESEGKLENINELVTAVCEFEPEPDRPALNQFLDQVALVSDVDAMNDDKGSVTMMTIHLAKGLEFPNVFMVGMEEGLFPHSRSLDDPDELEEERRLCYVGMTRAMNRLSLSHAFRRSLFGTDRYNVASRFLDEMPKELIERKSFGGSTSHYGSQNYGREKYNRNDFDQDSPPENSRPFSYTSSPKVITRKPFQNIPKAACEFDSDFDQRPPNERATKFARGVKVKHPLFGVGAILAAEPTSAGHRVTVKFQDGSTKRLIAECAGLILI